MIGNVRTTGKLPLYLAAGKFVLASRVGEQLNAVQSELRALEIRNDARLQSEARKERRRFARAQRKAAW